nr:Maf family protein [uncultured Solibaculum sp.]
MEASKLALILASASPRRRDFLKQMGLSFRVCPARGEEKIEPGWRPEEIASHLAKQKAWEVASGHPKDTVIGADTIVVLGSEVLGKPKDREQAVHMLRMLSGKTHQVMTGVWVILDGKGYGFVQKTEVTFYHLTESEIGQYVETGEPMDKAGAYGIQGLGMTLVKNINGDYSNVVGLPVARLMRLLRQLGQL